MGRWRRSGGRPRRKVRHDARRDLSRKRQVRRYATMRAVKCGKRDDGSRKGSKTGQTAGRDELFQARQKPKTVPACPLSVRL
jgi:hypothetical protein